MHRAEVEDEVGEDDGGYPVKRNLGGEGLREMGGGGGLDIHLLEVDECGAMGDVCLCGILSNQGVES